MAEIDPGAINSLFGNIKTYADYQKADQDFQLKKLQAGQALQTGAIDQQSKSNIFATQVLAAAAANGDQGAWQQGLNTLKNAGVNVDAWSPDVKQGAQQVTAAKLAQSPLGPLIDAQLKQQSNAMQMAALTGTIPPGTSAAAGGVPGAGLVQALLPSGSAGAPAAPALPAQPSTVAPAPAPNPAMPAPQNAAGQQTQAGDVLPPVQADPLANNVINQTVTNAANPAGTPRPALSAAPTPPGAPQPAAPVAASGAQTNAPAPNALAGQAPMMPDPKNFNDPTRTLAANQQAYKNALDAYQANPVVIQQAAQAKTIGDNLGKDAQSAASATAVFGKLQQNINALQNLNNSTPSDHIVPVGVQGWLSNNVGGGKDATALAQWNQVNVQQTINELAQLVDSGQIRSNKAIVQLLADSAEIPASLNADGRAKMIANLQSELNNVVSASQNISNIQTGAPQVGYQALAGAAQTASQAGATTPAQPSLNNIPMPQVQQLKTMIANAASPADAVKARVYFDQVHGPGAAQLVLGQ